MRRTVIPELLDSDAGTAEEIAASLADLRMVNRRFGGARVVRKLVLQIARGAGTRDVSVLDVGAGSGDVLQSLRRDLARAGLNVRAVAFDRSAGHLAPGVAAVQGDALALPFRDGSFSVVACSLFLHHLEPDEIRRFVAEALRVCRHAVVINDLRRSWTHLGLVLAGTPLYSSRLTRHDAPASVRRAYTIAELRTILPQPADFRRFYLCRLGAIVWKDGKSQTTNAKGAGTE